MLSEIYDSYRLWQGSGSELLVNMKKVQQQVTSALEGLKEDDVKELVIAYDQSGQ